MENAKVSGVGERDTSTPDFLRTLSYREFVTSLSMALILLALYAIMHYFSHIHWVESSSRFFKFLFFLLATLSNHVFYKVEHKRPNNFVGRNLHDYIFILTFLLLQYLANLLYGIDRTFHLDNSGQGIAIVMFLMFIIMLFELAVYLLRCVLNYLRWPIL